MDPIISALQVSFFSIAGKVSLSHNTFVMRSLKKAAKEGRKAASSGSQSVLAAAHGMGQSSSSTTLAAYVPGSAVDRNLLIVKVFKARNLKWGSSAKMIGFSKFRPFVGVSIQNIKIGVTGVGSSKVEEPKWNESFFGVTSSFLPRVSPGSLVKIELNDFDVKLGVTELGSCVITPTRATSPQSWEPQWYPTTTKAKGEGEVLVAAVFVPLDEAWAWTEVPMGDFPMRTGCNVRLYQDAYTPKPLLPHMPVRNAFEDMYESLSGAKEFIYMTGWSVWTKLYLLRGGKECPTLGELLKKKSEEGLQVCVLVWDELTSVDGVAAAGLMSTFDEETRAFFKDTKVHCRTLHRHGHQGYEEAVFSHHQKTIIIDQDKNCVAYVGGLDVTNGRWDDPEHRVFTSLDNDHKDDFYSACVPGAAQEVGPRQPWHDIHSRLEGQVAVDVFENFRQRWEFIPSGVKIQEKSESGPPAELKGVSSAGVLNNGGWNCQLLRSIDRYSIPTKKDESEPNVIRSIHNTYVLRIATAQRYIYVENQYFMGSSHFWDSKIDCGLRNLVPVLIVEKIISKIVAKQDFTAYILVPMFPEGIPDTVGVQAMLRWQFLTVSMMHKRIFDALKSNGITDKKVEDYLVFMCVANREEPPKVAGKKHGTVEFGRHMIYVHSKMIIVDDEFILIGSANINDRSLRGDRDTEIAVVCNQRPPPPNPPPPQSNEIHDFRLSLWVEHFGAMNDLFHHPQNPACARHVQALCKANWEKYISEDTSSRLVGHACKYPYVMDESNGSLKAAGNGKFPDYPLADIEGKLSALPNHVVT